MITPASAREGLQVAFTIIALFFIFVCFLIYYGRSKYAPEAVLSKLPLRTPALALVVGLYAAEVCLVALRGGPVAENELRYVSCLLAVLSWTVVGLRQSLLIVETFGLSIITLVFGIPLLIIEALYQKSLAPEPAHHYALLAVQAARLAILALVLLDTSCRMAARRRHKVVDSSPEARPLFGASNGDAASRVSYGSRSDPSDARSHVSCDSDSNYTSDSGSDEGEDEDADQRDSEASRLRRSGSWIAYVRKFKLFVPYMIPKKDHKVQGCILICLICVIGDRFLNILVPRQIGIIADKIVAGEPPFHELGLYLVLSLAQGDSGLELIQGLAKIPIELFSYRQITNAAFNHVMKLDMDFHSGRDSAEVMKAIEQGEALTNVVKTAFLDIMPTMVDMVVAFVFLYHKFSSSVALCMMFASLSFLVVEVVSSTWNIENRRRVTKTERREARVMHQAVQGWHTVSAFNMFAYEKFRFATAVDKHLTAKTAWMRRDALIQGLLQALVPITFVMLAALVIRQINDGHATPGDFVFLIQYWDYLIIPLKYLSHEYRFIMSDMIDSERMLDLFNTKPNVVDKQGVPPLGPVDGRVEFDKVSFSYETRSNAIRNVSFTVAPGETVALVGSTGSGKSSIIKLLMRYYDVTSGSIRVDGKDIREVTLGSLRNCLGVVPQDPLLFNATIMENLRYAKLEATDEQVYEACRAAAIHDKIMAFPDGYETGVGENGMRLSGGEVQRLAIARAFLKNPPILILDEATSAVDTETESEIQEAIRDLSTKRTTFVIAHRLSTIIHADQILVLQNGEVVERGTHQELLDKGGRYHSLWHRQVGDGSGESEEDGSRSGSGSESGSEAGDGQESE